MVESIANVVVGYGVAVGAQILIFPMFGLHVTLEQNLQMGAVFTIVSLARSYLLRRIFEGFTNRRLLAHTLGYGQAHQSRSAVAGSVRAGSATGSAG